MTVRDLVALLSSYRFDESSEAALQRGVELVLADAGLPFEREARLSGADRVDFLVDRTIGVECKTGGSLAATTRQLHRYAAQVRVESLVLVTTRARLARLPETLNGKPVAVVVTPGALA